MPKRRVVLFIALGATILFNIYFFFFSANSNQAIKGQWLAYMPELEASQMSDPYHPLVTYDMWDERYPKHLIVKEGRPATIFPKILMECGVSRFLLIDYVLGIQHVEKAQMPPRILMADLSTKTEDCLNESLFEGYELHELNGSYGADELDLNSQNLPILVESKNK